MNFRRVVIATALVGVLVSVFFGGWLEDIRGKAFAQEASGSAGALLTVQGLSSSYSLAVTDSSSPTTLDLVLTLSGATTLPVILNIAFSGNNSWATKIEPNRLTYSPTDIFSGTSHSAKFSATIPNGAQNQTGTLTLSGPGIATATATISINNSTAAATSCSVTDILSGLNDIGGAIGKIISCLVVGWGTDLNNWLFGTTSDPSAKPTDDSIFGKILHISAIRPPSLVEHAYAQGTNNDATNGLGSFEFELQHKDGPIGRVWQISMAVVNVVVIFALLAIAFANILHININTYAAKKALPGLIIGVVLANMSLLIIRFLADICSALSLWAANIGGANGITSLVLLNFPVALGKTTIFALPYVGAGLTILILIVPFVLIYYLFLIIAFLFTFLRRIITLYFLVMVSPLAFVAYGVPGFQHYFGKWWDEFLRYLFLFPIVLFGMAMVVVLASTLKLDQNNSLGIAGFVPIMLTFAAATLVLRLPKMITKTLDTAAGFKKVLSTAPSIIAAGGWGYNKFHARRLRAAEDRFATVKHLGQHNRDYQHAEKELDRVKNIKDHWGAARGWANIIANPESTIKTAWEARIKESQGQHAVASSSVNVPNYGYVGKFVPGYKNLIKQNLLDQFRGSDAAYKEQLERLKGASQLGDVNSAAQWVNWVQNQPLTLKEQVPKLLKYVNTLTAEKKQEVLAAVSGAKTNKDADKALIEAGITDAEALPSVTKAGIAAAINKALAMSGRRNNVTGTASTKMLNFDDFVSGLPFGTPIQPGSSTNPNPGQGNPPADGGGSGGSPVPVPPAGPASPAAQARAQEGLTQIELIRPDAAQINPVNGQNIQQYLGNLADQWRDAEDEFAGLDLNSPAARTRANELQATIERIHTESLTALNAVMTADGQQVLADLRQVGGVTGQESVRQTVENVAAALELGINSGNATDSDLRSQLQQRLEAAHDFSAQVQAANQQASAANTEFSQQFVGLTDDQLRQQWSTISQNLAEAIGQRIDPLVSKLGERTGKNPGELKDSQQRLAQTIATELNKAMNIGPKSLRTALQSALTNLGTKFAKDLKLHQLSTSGSIKSALNQAQSAAPANPNITVEATVTAPTVDTTPPSSPAVDSASSPATPPPSDQP